MTGLGARYCFGMRSLPLVSLSAMLALSTACDKGSSESPAATADPETPAADPGSPPVQRLQGAIEIPAAVPSDAIAIFSVRVPSSMFTSMLSADPMGLATEGMDDLKKELDEFFGKTVGIQVLDATAITGFARGEKDFGIILSGVGGGIKAKKTGEHGGVAIYSDGDSPIRLAQQGDMLILGTETAVKASIDASADASKSAKGGELAKFIAEQSDGAAMAIAADLTKLPAEFTREIPPTVMVDRGLLTFGFEGLKLRAEGETDKIDALAGVVNSGLAMAAGEAEKQRERVLKDPDDVAEGAAIILGAHYMRSAKKMLTPTVDGGTLTIEVPIKAGDPAILAAVAGIGAAIAVPAFVKYTRRSKTAEARVQIAKMFDAASAYFNEEHVDRGPATDTLAAEELAARAPHRCPNNGKLSGESGVTPPLSVDCNAGPGGRCVPSAGGKGGPGHYDMSLWTDNDVWNGLNFQQEEGHHFHYNFIWTNDASGYGSCQFTAQAFGDLDGDGVFSTFERSGAGDENGMNGAAGLYIDKEVE